MTADKTKGEILKEHLDALAEHFQALCVVAYASVEGRPTVFTESFGGGNGQLQSVLRQMLASTGVNVLDCEGVAELERLRAEYDEAGKWMLEKGLMQEGELTIPAMRKRIEDLEREEFAKCVDIEAAAQLEDLERMKRGEMPR